MSKKELGLLGYLGYKSVKNEPSKLGKEIGECIIGIIFAMILMGVFYVIMTLFLQGPSLIMNNLEIIGILIGVSIVIFIILIVGYVIYDRITHYLERKEQKLQEKRRKKRRKEERKQKILNYNPNNSKYKVCMECGYENPKNLSKCWECGADLNNQKPKYTKKHIGPESKTINNNNTQIKSSKKKLDDTKKTQYKRLRSKRKYVRCPKCNSLVNLEHSSVCRYCNYDILSENFQYCPFCTTKIPSNAKVCHNCNRHLTKDI